MFNYNESMDFILSTQKFGSRLGLFSITQLMSFLKNPQDTLKIIHVAGTNGKGSTTCFISNILISAKYKTGVYTSPSLKKYNERISINNVDISDEDFAKYAYTVKLASDKMVENGMNHPTEFEIITAMALCYYKDMKCDVVILEVGLGGELDATNVIKTPNLTVITKIDFDHTEYLGNTLLEITMNKAGIIKQNSKVVLYNQNTEVVQTIQNKCSLTNSTLNIADVEDVILISKTLDGQSFFYQGEKYSTAMIGSYQLNNAVLAIESAKMLSNIGYNISKENIKQGLVNSHWPGRVEVISRKPIVIVDGAHNLDGAAALAKSIKELFNDKKLIFVTGILKDKNYQDMIKAMIPYAKEFITITPTSPRALAATTLCEYIKTLNAKATAIDSISLALQYAKSCAEEDDIICVFGSLYHLGEVREFFLQ